MKKIFTVIRSWFCSHDFELKESYSGADIHVSYCNKCGIYGTAVGKAALKYKSRITKETKFFTLVNGDWIQDKEEINNEHS